MKHVRKYQYIILGLALVFVLGGFAVTAVPALADTFGVSDVGNSAGLGATDIRTTIGRIIKVALGLLGVVAVGIILYGGFVYMTAGGNEENVSKAKKIMINGTIGLVIILSAMTITQFIFNKLSEATGSGTTSGGCVGTFEECNDDNDFFGSCAQQSFFSLSITPSQDTTDMNNIAIRVVFSQSVGTDVNQILDITRAAENINDKFEFAFVEGTDNKVLEALYTSQNNCDDVNNNPEHECLPVSENKYNVRLREDVVSESGEKVNSDTDCIGIGEPVTDVDFEVNKKVNDVGVPAIGEPITFETPDGVLTGSGNKLLAGTTYKVKVSVQDASGIGFVQMRVEETGGGDVLFDTYDGPDKGESAEMYEFSYNLVIPVNVVPQTEYTVAVNAFDIDHNVFQTSETFVVVPSHCDNDVWDEDEGETDTDVGGPCGCADGEACQCSSNAQCAIGYACIDTACIEHPEIVEISPQDGDSGNWISIIGAGFGDMGLVEFGEEVDTDVEGKAVYGNWKTAENVKCDIAADTWTNNYAVVKVPDEIADFSAIRITRAGDDLSDTSVDDYGVKPLPKNPGLLKKFIDNNYPAGTFVKEEGLTRPGLCGVVALQQGENGDITLGPEGLPGSSILAEGTAFGDDINAGELNFIANAFVLNAGIDDWNDTAIKSSVPGTISPGKPAVQVTANGEKSNKVLFEVLPGDNADVTPIVMAIDPSVTTTMGSFITVSGTNFGDVQALVHLAPDNSTDCSTPGTCPLLDFDLPDFCGDTWTNTQIIGKIPENVNFQEYFIIVERAAGLKSQPSHSITIEDGPPLPGICWMSPVAGPAPFPQENESGILLKGINFKEKSFTKNPEIFFWRNGADAESLDGWLSSDKDTFPPNQGVTSQNPNSARTFIPYGLDGQSMQSGLIKLEGFDADGNSVGVSNGVRYEVSDCRDAIHPMDGFKCCAEGEGAGSWVKSEGLCPGEDVESGYAWRFTTGLIPDLPHVLEQCNIDDWNDAGAAIQMPSPVPSTKWPSGDNACVNANIEFAVNVGLDPKSILGEDNAANTADDNIKVYKCGSGDVPDCGEYELADTLGGLDLGAYDKTEIVTVWDAKDKELDPNTWYRVVLSDQIVSVPLDTGTGSKEVRPLLATSPLADLPGTAYHYDFKTSEEVCFLQQAFVVPPSKTTHILGLLTQPWNDDPFYYHLKGKANQVCTLISVDGKGWKWNSNPSTKAEVTPAPLVGPGGEFLIEDSRATVEAIADAPEGVAITAKIPDAGDGFDESFNSLFSLLGYVGVEDVGLNIFNVGTIKKFPAADLDDFDVTKPFSLEYKFKVNDNLPMNKAVAYRKGQFKIEVTADKKVCFVTPTEPTVDGPSQVSACSNSIQFLNGSTQHFVWTWDGSNLKMFDNNGLLTSVGLTHIPESDGELWVGGQYGPIYGPMSHTVYIFGMLPTAIKNSHAISHLNGGQNIDFIAKESILTIDLFDPEVIYFEPNCSESCVNTDIRVDFNRPMAIETYEKGFQFFKCQGGADGTSSANCKTAQLVDYYTVDLTKSNDTTLRATISQPNLKLEKNTWYKVSLSGQDADDTKIKSLGKLNPPKHGKALPKTEWVFRTQNDGTPCAVNRLEISPHPFTLYYIGQKAIYTAIPFSSPNACSKSGQAVNKWDYGYEWKIDPAADQQVAKVSNFNSGFGWNSQCSFQCLRTGSTVSKQFDAAGQSNKTGLCGNGFLEAGEDCELTEFVDGEANPDQGICGLNCLYDPNSDKGKALVGSDPAPLTGLGALDEDGVGKSYCGDTSIDEGEACDPGDPSDPQYNLLKFGCTDRCLHTGTSLSAYWCENEANSAQKQSIECKLSVSVCGNGKLEDREECEIGEIIDGVEVTVDMCDQQCLFRNLCDVPELKQCDPDHFYCNDDCTLGGSSVLYEFPSLCGDGAVGPGEDNVCEILVPPADLIEGSSPVQVATTIGEGESDDQGSQHTKIRTELHGVAGINGTADLTLQCGYTEYTEPISDPLDDQDVKEYTYNDCHDNELNEFGVGSNTCCRLRPRRTDQYPAENQGIGSEPVCRNSYIEVTFDKEMLSGSLSNGTPNIGGAVEYEPVVVNQEDVRLMTFVTDEFGNKVLGPDQIPLRVVAVSKGEGSNLAKHYWTLYPGEPGLVNVGGETDEPVEYYVVDSNFTEVVREDGTYFKATFEPIAGADTYVTQLADSEFDLDKEDGDPDKDIKYDINVAEEDLHAYNLDGLELFVQIVNVPEVVLTEDEATKIQELLTSNLFLAVGYKDPNYVCELNGGIDVTEEIAAVTGLAQVEEPGFWKNLWNKVKSFFAGIVEFVFAADGPEAALIGDANIWCAAEIPIDVNVTYDVTLIGEGDAQEEKVDTRVSVFIKKLLKSDAIHVVYLRGGAEGIKDVYGVGIKAAADTVRNDAWFFKTGDKVCKIDEVTATPDSHLYSEPNTAESFVAFAKTKSGQLISPIAGVYDWDWMWKPENPVFDIPDVDTADNEISSTNVEGHVNGIVQAVITEDKDDSEDYQPPGTKFVSYIDLTALFCENPWPEYNFDGSWDPYKHNLFNFSFYYCADAGVSGNIYDDLPYLKQPFDLDQQEKLGSCEGTGEACVDTSQCPIKYVFSKAGGEDHDYEYNYEPNKPGVCAIKLGEEQINEFETNITFINHGDSINDGYDVRFCQHDFECKWGTVEAEAISKGKTQDDIFCNTEHFGFPPKQMECKTNVLEKSLFFNNLNEDAFGLQVFRNEDGLPISEWYKKQFNTEELGAMQPVTVAGYEGLTDTNNYYINAMNFVPQSGQIFHNVYLFSVNEGVSGSTEQVFNKILDSLTFNINMTDYGLCLVPDAAIGPDGVRYEPEQVSNVSCSTDFDCKDENGSPREGTNGVCSNAITKFFRDWQRVHDIQAAQNKLEAYFANTANLPTFEGDLKSGTFVPGYTNSRWTRSWKTLGDLIDGVGIDPVSDWTACSPDTGTDQQTCWNAEDAVYHCPVASQVYEYSYDAENKGFTFHAPLEFFLISDQITNAFVDLGSYSTQPWCTGKGLSYSPDDEVCGNGVVGKTEVCDPAGYTIVGDKGLLADQPGTCSLYPSQSCLNGEADCMSHTATGNFGNLFTDGLGVCGRYVNKEVGFGSFKFDAQIEIMYNHDATDAQGGVFVGVPCSADTQCQSLGTYGVYDKVGHLYFDTANPNDATKYNYKHTAQVDFYDSFFNANKDDLTCLQSLDFQPDACIGVVEGVLEGFCAPGEVAKQTCNADCSGWEYGQCASVSECGNGLVEQGESCDDGALNGTYGHCSTSCTQTSGSFCGDGIFDPAEELCDWSHPDWSHGPVFYQQSKYYNANKDQSCSWDCQSPGLYCGDGILHEAEGEECDDGNNVDDDACNNSCELTVVACKESIEYMYNDYAPTTQDPDQGTPITVVQLGSDNELNELCKPYTFSEICKSFNNYDQSNCIFLGYTPIEGDASQIGACGDGGSIANVTDLKLQDVASIYYEDIKESECTQLLGNCKQSCVNSGAGNLIAQCQQQCEFQMYPDCLDNFEDYYEEGFTFSDLTIQCRDHTDGAAAAAVAVSKDADQCGNGAVETYIDDAGDEIVEVCDKGVENGIECDPAYGESCTFCSQDCKTVLTVDSDNFCGNGKIDEIGKTEEGNSQVESCDVKADGTVVHFSSESFSAEDIYCPDKGVYECTNNCLVLKNNCVSCGVSGDGATPKFSVINPLFDWDHKLTSAELGQVRLYQHNGDFDPFTLGWGDVVNIGDNPWEGIFWKPTNPGVQFDKIETDPLCTGEYYVANRIQQLSNEVGEYSHTALEEQNKTALFEYPVDGEVAEVNHEYIMSPPLPPHTYRVVLSWDNTGDLENAQFNSEFYDPMGKIQHVSYIRGLYEGGLCRKAEKRWITDSNTAQWQNWDTQYWWAPKYVQGEDLCYPYNDRIRVNQEIIGKQRTVQSFTIDVGDLEYAGGLYDVFIYDDEMVYKGDYAFLVQTLNGIPIAQLTDQDLRVDIYTYQEGQDSLLSYYKPTYSFPIENAIGTSSNEFAKYWHVFNIEFNTDTSAYELKPAESIETNVCQIKQSLELPDALDCI